MIFIINDIDFSSNIVVDTYEVNSKPSYVSWTNANYKLIKCKTAEKVVGNFNMFFRTREDYQRFKDALDASRTDGMTHVVALSVNNSNTNKFIDAYIDFELQRNVDGTRNDFYNEFTVTIEEA